jgi:hypothetical protein
MAEVGAGSAHPVSMGDRLFGPHEVSAYRVIRGTEAAVTTALLRWFERHELLVVQRQQPGWISWEPLRGMQAAIRRGTAAFDTSRPKFMLSRADLVVATVTPIEGGYCHLALRAEMGSVRRGHGIGAGVSVGFGALGSVGLATFGALAAIVPVPAVMGAMIAFVALGRTAPIARRIMLGLERALDAAESAATTPAGAEQPSLLDALASEVRKALSPGRTPRDPRRDRGANG